MSYTKTLSVKLPKICNTGPAPVIRVKNNILKILNVNISSNTLAFDILNKLYTTRKFSQSKIADLLNVQRDTIHRWLVRLKIPIRDRIDVVIDALLKYVKHSFSGDIIEKAYLIGIRYGDLHVCRHGKSIRVSVASAHPEMITLFKKLFERYGNVGVYAKYNSRRNKYLWSTYCDLNSSFNFLLNNNKVLLKWLLHKKSVFLSFLSGYFDAEGCISISNKSKRRAIQFLIKSCDYALLKSIVIILDKMKFSIKGPFLEKLPYNTSNKYQGFSYTQSYWRIVISTKSDILKLLDLMCLKHKEKIWKFKLAKELENTDWKNAELKIIKLRTKIRQGVLSFCKKAEIKLQAK